MKTSQRRALRTHVVEATRGLAALSVVMVLFFIMALVAAYTNRNLIFEQRVAANSYRSEQALVAADGGVDWAIQMLNSGRVTTACLPSANSTDLPVRQRFLPRNDAGAYVGVTSAVYMSCVVRNAALTCVCPTTGTPDPSPHAVKDWPINGGGSAFRINLLPPGTGASPGALVVNARGCGTTGTGATSCGAATAAPEADGIVALRQTVGLVRALPIPPSAALTVGTTVDTGVSALRISNPDNSTGLTAHTGGTLTAGAGSQFIGPAGGSDDGQLVGDAALASLVPAPTDLFGANDLLFRSMFGMPPATYNRQPGLVRFNCASAACTAADLRGALDRYPGLPLWFDGDLTLDAAPSAAALGTADDPAMVIVTGRLTISAALELQGFFYASAVSWNGAAASASVRGALVAVNDFTADAAVTVVYDAPMLRKIQLFYGSFVRAPGGWNRVDRGSGF